MRKPLQAPWIPLLITVLLGSAALAIFNDRFLTSFNVYVILSDAAILFVIGAAQLVVLSVREFNLSVGGIGALSGIALGYALTDHGLPLAVGVVICLAVGAACGLLNGIIVSTSGVNGFIVTLATGGLFSGIAVGTTEARPFTVFPEALATFGQGRWGFIPYLLIFAGVVAIGLAVFYRWAKLGRIFLAVGGNPEAAELSGLSSRRALVSAHTLSGVLSAMAAIMVVAKVQSARPTSGADWLLESFVVAIIGGTALAGGVVSVPGAFVAAAVVAVIHDGLIVSDVDQYWVTAINGLVIFAAVLMGATKLRGFRRRDTTGDVDGPPPSGEGAAVRRPDAVTGSSLERRSA
jgi:ribose transport system permease protein